VDYGPVVFPSHIGKVFHVKIVCLVLVVFGYIFSAYIILYFIVSYKFTQRESFVYCCFSQHIQLGGQWPFLRLATTLLRRVLDFFGAIVKKVLSRWLIDTMVQMPRSYSAPLRKQLRFSVEWLIWHASF
jgi:hypothetical protein